MTYYDNLSDEEHEELCEFLDSLQPTFSIEEDLAHVTERCRCLRRMADEAPEIDDQLPF